MNEELKVIISAEIDKLRQGVEKAKQSVKGFKDQVKAASADVDKTFANMGTAITNGAKAAVTGLAAAGGALLALGASTAEYRAEQAKLISAFETAGSSAEVAKETYNDLYRVLGDGGQATEAANHLAKLTTEEKALSEWTNICQGVYATFGASLPIEGLTEAANETAKVGTVTGSLADALNWAGISEDAFNEKLEACNTEAEREKLIRETLNGLYSEAASTYESNNAQVLAQNEAQAKLQETMALLGEAVAPIITAFTQFANEALALVVPYIQELADNYMPLLTELLGGLAEALGAAFEWISQHKEILAVMAGIIGGIATAIGLYNAVAAIKAAMDAAQVTTIWALVAAHAAQAVAAMAALAPYLLVVAAIAAVIAIIVLCIKYWDDIVAALKKAWEKIKEIWGKVASWFNDKVIKPVVNFFKGLWTSITNIFNKVKDWFSEKFKSAVTGIKNAFSSVASFFKGIWSGITGVFSSIGSWFSDKFKAAVDGVKRVFSTITGFFSGIWNSIKSIFSNVGSAIAGAITNTVKSAINKVLSTAVKIINGFISAINFAIGIINAIPGVNISKISQLSVPAMAKGGVVDSATLALIGEQGKEAVVPLENNTEWMDKLATMLSARIGGGNTPIVLNVDGKVFAQTAINTINQQTRQTGKLALNLA